jgi:hypothetical protein
MKQRCLRTEDGGMASRKMWFAGAIALLVIVAAKVLPEAAVGDAVMGLVSVCAIYVGGNTATKWVLGRAPGLTAAPASKTDPEPTKP